MTRLSVYETKKAWEELIAGKTISEVMFSDIGILCGFRLNDGTIIHYDRKKGVYIDIDRATGETIKYN